MFPLLQSLHRTLFGLLLLLMLYRSQAFASSHGSKAFTSSLNPLYLHNNINKNGHHLPSCADATSKIIPAEYVAETKLPTDVGQFQLRAYRVPGAPLGQEPCVIYCRDKPPFGTATHPAQHVPVRIHDQCLTSEVFRSQR